MSSPFTPLLSISIFGLLNGCGGNFAPFFSVLSCCYGLIIVSPSFSYNCIAHCISLDFVLSSISKMMIASSIYIFVNLYVHSFVSIFPSNISIQLRTSSFLDEIFLMHISLHVFFIILFIYLIVAFLF